MAPFRSSSPTGTASPGRFDLSPASKVKAALAMLDSDSSEDDSTAKNTKKQPKQQQDKSPRPSSPATSHNDANSESEDDDIMRPRGRLASRMQADDKPAAKADSSTTEDARERVRRMLMAKTADATAQPATEGDAGDVEMADADANNDDDEDEEDIPIQPRRLLKKTQRQSKTPESTPSRSQREESPGMFVTPTKPSTQPGSPLQGGQTADSGSDEDLPSLKGERFRALVERKRKERLAREAEEAAKKAARLEAQKASLEDLGNESSDITDDEGGRKLTQSNSRPTRRAGKKALEEMNRETQRINRSMQLAHEAKTKKKITKASLFERFNFNPHGGNVVKEKVSGSSRPQTPSSGRHTDAEMKDPDTPPSSPPARVEDVLGKDLKGTPVLGAQATREMSLAVQAEGEDDDEEFPDLNDLASSAPQKLDKGKGKATAADILPTKPVKRQFRLKQQPLQANRVEINLDDDLVIVKTKKSKMDALFDRVPKNKARESRSLYNQRQLAHLDSPENRAHKKIDKTAITSGELQVRLAQQAREQAKLERERRLEMLAAKGIHVPTEEEREAERAQVDDIVARARQQDEELMQKEREAAKKERKAAGKDDPLAWDDSDSEGEYLEPEEVSDIELSGSEGGVDDDDAPMASGDDAEQEDIADVEQETLKKNPAAQAMFDEEADSDESESQDDFVDPDEEDERHRWGVPSDEEGDVAPKKTHRPKKQVAILSEDDEDMVPRPIRPRKQNTTVLSDDEDMGVEATPKPKSHMAKSRSAPNSSSPNIPTSVLRSATKTFIPGLPVTAGGPAGLGLTQIFAGTMDDSQVGLSGGSPSQLISTFTTFPDSQFSQNVANSADDGMVMDSQPEGTQKETQASDKETQVQFTFSQTETQTRAFEDVNGTQVSELVDPTQDGGFANYTPLKERFVPSSPMSTDATVATAINGQTRLADPTSESPVEQRKGRRLIRKRAVASDSEDEAADDAEDEFGFGTVSAFNVMKDAAAKEKQRKAREDYDKKKSKAKEMVDEQAEESEDEYAGLGGVDGEDSDDDAASVHEMIDDNTQANSKDKAQVAAFHADRERADDEKQVDKLFRDITSGMLRKRKGGADYDLSDEDDGGEARRRMKRRQFAKMQKALFTDERISKVAENPRNQAFMRTIEDAGSDEEMDFIFEPPSQPQGNESQSQSEAQDQQNTTVPDSQPPAAGQARNDGSMRPPAAARRTKDGKKPSNIGEIRETLSNLLEEGPSGNTVISATDLGSDSEGDDEGGRSDKENANPRRNSRHTVVDRISLKRQSSSNVSATGTGRMAFAAPSASGGGGSFKVPALLRRATTNSSLMSSGTSSSAGGSAATGNGSGGGFGDEGKIKKNAGKRSGINYFARENDRRAALAESQKRREAKKWKGAEGRSKAVGGLFGAGKFE